MSTAQASAARPVSGWRSTVSLLAVITAATVSGVCGLSYEVLFTRMLSTYFGSIFYVGAAVIAGFLFGIGVSSFFAHRFARYLGQLEIAIGVFAAIAMLLFRYAGTAPLPWIGLLAESPTLLALAPGLLILLPGLMIGASLPMFAVILRWYCVQGGSRDTKDDSNAFRWAYMAYNLGGAACVIAVELVLVRAMGISATGLCLAATNIILGAWLCLRMTPPTTAFYSDEAKCTQALSARRILALAITGLASGAFQILFLEVASHLWGATTTTLAGTLAAVLVGGAIGAQWVNQRQFHLGRWLLRGAVIFAAFFAAILPLIHLWAMIAEPIYHQWGLYAGWVAQGLFVTLVGIPVFTVFGGTEPAALCGRVGTVFEAGKALGICALTNAIGAVIMIFYVHPNVSDAWAMAGMAVMVLVAAFVDKDKDSQAGEIA